MEMKPMNEKKTLYVGGLEENVDKAALYSLFIPFGDVYDIVIPLEHERSQKHRGFAFVEFELAEDAAHALENMNDAEFYGKVLKINFAKPDAMAQSRAIWEQNDYHIKGVEEKVAMEQDETQTTAGPSNVPNDSEIPALVEQA